MKTCKDCELPFPYDNFHRKTNLPDGHSYYCKGCTSERAKKHYRNNDGVRKKAIERSQLSKQEARVFVLEYLLAHPCSCGEARPACLDFDHQRNKTMNISSMVAGGYSIETIQLEIEKCKVLCANCHRAKTAEDFGWYSWYPR